MAASLEDFSPEQLAEMGKLYANMVNNPATREATLRATKKAAPNTPIPEIDVLDRVGAGIKPYVDKQAAMEQKLMEADARAKLEEKRAMLRDQGRTKDEIAAIEKIMVEKQIPDHATAAEFYTLQSKAAAPTAPTYQYQPQKLPVDKEAAKAAGGFKNFFLQDAHKAVEDLRAGKIKLQ